MLDPNGNAERPSTNFIYMPLVSEAPKGSILLLKMLALISLLSNTFTSNNLCAPVWPLGNRTYLRFYVEDMGGSDAVDPPSASFLSMVDSPHDRSGRTAQNVSDGRP